MLPPIAWMNETLSQLEEYFATCLVGAICSTGCFFFVLRSRQCFSWPAIPKSWQIRRVIRGFCVCGISFALGCAAQYMNDQQRKIAAATTIATTLAIAAEGIRHFAYYDPPGVLTVCYGHTGKDVHKEREYSLAECQALLSDDMRRAITQVATCAPNAPEPVLAAFSDAVFNLGPTIACNTQKSTAARLLKQGDWDGACKQLPRWNKASIGGVMVALPGLTQRRQAEMNICLGGQ